MAMSRQNQQLLMFSTVLIYLYLLELTSAEPRNYLNPKEDCDGVQSIYQFAVTVTNLFSCTVSMNSLFNPITSCGGIETTSNVTEYDEINKVTSTESCSIDDEGNNIEEYTVEQKFSRAVNNTICKKFENCVTKQESIHWLITAAMVVMGAAVFIITGTAIARYLYKHVNRKNYQEIKDSSTPELSDYKQADLITKARARSIFPCCGGGKEDEQLSFRVITADGKRIYQTKNYGTASQTTAASSQQSQDIENQQPEATPIQQQAAMS